MVPAGVITPDENPKLRRRHKKSVAQILKEAQTAEIDDALIGRVPTLLEILDELAHGVYYEKQFYDRKGNPSTVKVYKQVPDKEVIKYMIDRALGKPIARSQSDHRELVEVTRINLDL